MYIMFLPWVVFVLVARRSGLDVQWASWSALVVGLAILCIQARRRRSDLVLAGVLVVFVALLLVQFASGPAVGAFLEAQGRALVSAGVGLVLFASVATGHPASTTWGRRGVPPWAARTPEFHQLVRRTALEWACGMCALAGLFAAASVVGGPVGRTLFGWLGPLALCLVMVQLDAANWRRFSSAITLGDDRRRTSNIGRDRLPARRRLGPAQDDAESAATVYSFTAAASLVHES
jgi:hypothetical protein